jgi:hypothetical protein
MEELMIGMLFAFIYIIAKVKDCGNNPEYEAWLTQVRQKLYDEN